MATDTSAGRQSLSSDVLNLAADKARRYVADMAERRVSPSEAAVAGLAELNESFPLLPSDPSDVIARLDELAPPPPATTGGRYFGFVNGGMVPAALAANWLAAAWNQNAALRVMSPIAAELEEIVLRWFGEALGLLRNARGLGYLRYHGEFHGARRGTSCAPGTRRMGCHRRRDVGRRR